MMINPVNSSATSQVEIPSIKRSRSVMGIVFDAMGCFIRSIKSRVSPLFATRVDKASPDHINKVSIPKLTSEPHLPSDLLAPMPRQDIERKKINEFLDSEETHLMITEKMKEANIPEEYRELLMQVILFLMDKEEDFLASSKAKAKKKLEGAAASVLAKFTEHSQQLEAIDIDQKKDLDEVIRLHKSDILRFHFEVILRGQDPDGSLAEQEINAKLEAWKGSLK